MGIVISVVLLFITDSFALFALGLVATLLVSVIVAVATKDDDAKTERYQRQWYCLKCGRNYHEPENGPAPEAIAEDAHAPHGESEVD